MSHRVRGAVARTPEPSARERPILFSGEMVKAILAGRKTQTRRIVTVPWKGATRALPYSPYWVDSDGELQGCDEYGDYHEAAAWLGTYAVGDRLWVRETWRAPLRLDDTSPRVMGEKALDAGYPTPWAPVLYEADGTTSNWDRDIWGTSPGKTRPGIHMPRWASRITLAVTSVRIERLNAITEADAKAEGVEIMRGEDCWDGTHLLAFEYLWGELHGWQGEPRAKPGHLFHDNPWVWRVEFRVVEQRAGRSAA